MVN
ncbi:hypothetical protein CP03DC29_0343A, partial [Chlamydia psittaci 03DC29]|jgi:hypothetical protein